MSPRRVTILPDFGPYPVPVRSTELWQAVLDALRLAIVSGDLPPGTPLREDALARKLGVSRGPIREALRRLEHEGLVEVLPRRGAFALDLTPEDVHELYAMRTLLEVYAARHSATAGRQRVNDGLDRLDMLAREMYEAAKHSTQAALAQADLAFHRQLMLLSSKRRLLTSWDTLAGPVGALLSVTNRRHTDVAEVLPFHSRIVEALRGSDPDAAEAAVRGHMEHVERIMLAALDRETRTSANHNHRALRSIDFRPCRGAVR